MAIYLRPITNLKDLEELEQLRHETHLLGDPLHQEFAVRRRKQDDLQSIDDGRYRYPLPSFQCRTYIAWLITEEKQQREGRLQHLAQLA